jgi:hypothetical protein
MKPKTTSVWLPFATWAKSKIKLLTTFVLASGMAMAAQAQNLVLNGDFTANASSFTTFPGNLSLGSNPASITDWYQIVGGGPVGVNGAGVGFSGPFGPTADGGLTYAFIQSGVNGLAQNLTGLMFGSAYTLSFDVASRASNPSVSFRVQIGDAAVTYVSTQVSGSDVLIGNPDAFTHYSYSFTTPSTFTGGPSIQLYNLTAGDNTIDFANVSVVVAPEPTTAALVGLGILLAGAGRWTRRRIA